MQRRTKPVDFATSMVCLTLSYSHNALTDLDRQILFSESLSSLDIIPELFILTSISIMEMVLKRPFIQLIE